MSILPSFLEAAVSEEAAEPGRVLPVPREYGLDFRTGRMTGQIVEGLEAVKVWIWNCLKTERYRHAIYSWIYGTEFEQYIGQSLSDEYLQSDCQAETEDALLVSPYIRGIEDFTAEVSGDRLRVVFRAVTTLGDTGVEMYV